MTSDIILYDYWRSSASHRVRIALALKGIAYQTIGVNLLDRSQKSAGHLERNPQGLVPALEIDGFLLTQSLAIIQYLDETRPGPGLIPGNPADRARVHQLSHVIAMDIHPVCNLTVATHAAAISGGGDPAKKEWMHHFIAPGLEALEAMLDHPSTGRFCHGDEPGMADCCLVPQLYNARRWDVPLDHLPIISAIEAACEDHALIAQAHPDKVGPPE